MSPGSHRTCHHVGSWSLSTQLLLSLLSVRLSRKDQSLVLVYLFPTHLLLVLSYLTNQSIIICMLMTINFLFLLSPLNSAPKFHTSKPLLILSLSGCLPICFHLISPKRCFSSSVFLLNFPKSRTPVFSCHLTPTTSTRAHVPVSSNCPNTIVISESDVTTSRSRLQYITLTLVANYSTVNYR